MLGLIRKFLETRAARLFFVVLIVPFVLFGVANVAQNWGGDTALATIGDRRIEPAQFQEAFRRNMAQVARMTGGKTEPTPAMRRGIAAETLQQLINQAAVENEVKALGLAVPDGAVRDATFDIPNFRGPGGNFDRNTFLGVLRQNNLTEARFIELIRANLGQRQLLDAVQAGTATPDVLLAQVFAFQREQRVADLVELPFSAAPTPPDPTEQDLRTAYDDDPQRYAAPAFRRIKAVVLSADTIARTMDIPEPTLRAYYDEHKAEFGAVEKRAVDVLVAPDEAAAAKLAEQWKAGADWPTMQAAATAVGATATQLADSTEAEIPGTELAQSVFKATPNAVTGPDKSPFGWQVIRVTNIVPGTDQTFDGVRDQVQQRVAHARAADDVYPRANKLEDALSASPNLDDLPGDLGVAAITGTLDAQGNTQDGEPAPIPGSPALRQAIVTAAFATARHEPPRLVEGPDQSYFALSVEDETPPQQRPFADVRTQLRDNWEHDARRHAQEVVAARLLAAAQAGGSLDDAATVAGVRAERTPPIGRSSPTPGVPAAIIQPLFALPPNGATMLEDPEGFIVVKLAAIQAPAPSSDPAAADQMRTALTQALNTDIQSSYAVALRTRAHPTVNQRLLDTLSQ